MKIVHILFLLLLACRTALADDTPLNVNEWQAASEILVEAKARIQKAGWQQGATDAVSKECVSTALEGAWKNLGYSLVDFQYALKAMSQAIGVDNKPVTYAGDPLSVPYWGRNFMYWNDAQGRTEKEVLAAFDSAISIAKNEKSVAFKVRVFGVDLESFDKKALMYMLNIK